MDTNLKPGFDSKAVLINLPSSVFMGIFCKFVFEDDNLHVLAPTIE